MGKPDVNVLEDGKLRTGQPKSNEEVKVGETTRRSLGKPSSHKDKIHLDDQLIMRQPKSNEEVEVQRCKIRKKE